MKLVISSCRVCFVSRAFSSAERPHGSHVATTAAGSGKPDGCFAETPPSDDGDISEVVSDWSPNDECAQDRLSDLVPYDDGGSDEGGEAEATGPNQASVGSDVADIGVVQGSAHTEDEGFGVMQDSARGGEEGRGEHHASADCEVEQESRAAVSAAGTAPTTVVQGTPFAACL